ncbi:MAG: DUF4411 domain-containing protein [Candidatus Thorarchaeota archaeon]|nr:MAG: DUF4411 domain-containing protein [Candidatus Thorarchaeota archaeon]RLI54184.1 MAG: DUF4411 domain-containing protein [Candidatus Thorarchaeota archaeon]
MILLKYSFDTSAFIQPFRDYYPPDVFPTLWDLIGSLIERGDIIATKEVQFELQQKDDKLVTYVRRFPGLFVELSDEVQREAHAIINHYPGWVDPYKHKNMADPFVIALARVHDLTVVSYEEEKKGRVKIPRVCKDFGVRHFTFVDFLRDARIVI